MTHYLPEPHRGLRAPASGKLARTLKQMDAQAVVFERADELRLGRSVQATSKGMAGIGRIAAEYAAWSRAQPHAEQWFRAAAEGGVATVLGRIYETGY